MNWGYILGSVVGGVLATLYGQYSVDQDWRARTIERGVAVECPDTGQWAWAGECE